MEEPSKEDLLCHKIAAYCMLLGEALDELNPSEIRKSRKREVTFSDKCIDLAVEVMHGCQAVSNSIFEEEEIRKGTYIQDLSDGVEEVVKQNYELIKTSKDGEN